jgi:acyl-CoA hydrolase
MEIGVRIEAQDPTTRKTAHTGSCYLTYVALDLKGRPTAIPKLLLKTGAERKRANAALARRKIREAENAALTK